MHAKYGLCDAGKIVTTTRIFLISHCSSVLRVLWSNPTACRKKNAECLDWGQRPAVVQREAAPVIILLSELEARFVCGGGCRGVKGVSIGLKWGANTFGAKREDDKVAPLTFLLAFSYLV